MKIAIHKCPGSYSDRWITYCDERQIPYKIVRCYDTDIVDQLRDCDGLLWHWSHTDYRDQNFARQLTASLEQSGIKVFPDVATSWHFDDKVGQKYLLESIQAPLVSTYVFYNKNDALKWLGKTKFPKVFKLRGGAGSANVVLVNNLKQAKNLVSRAFANGFPMSDNYSGLKQRLWVLRRDKDINAVTHLLKGIGRMVLKNDRKDLLPRQKGYVYFQDFVPNNDFDDRIVVVGNRAFALRRFVRHGDFRASGSGIFAYDKEHFDRQTIKIAFEIAKSLKTQSLAFDFVYGNNKLPLIVEVSYAYAMGSAYDSCPGFWDSDLIWHDQKVNPQYFIIEDFINCIKDSSH